VSGLVPVQGLRLHEGTQQFPCRLYIVGKAS
jgi:hypothetical protein